MHGLSPEVLGQITLDANKDAVEFFLDSVDQDVIAADLSRRGCIVTPGVNPKNGRSGYHVKCPRPARKMVSKEERRKDNLAGVYGCIYFLAAVSFTQILPGYIGAVTGTDAGPYFVVMALIAFTGVFASKKAEGRIAAGIVALFFLLLSSVFFFRWHF